MIERIIFHHSIVYDFVLSIARITNFEYTNDLFRSYDGDLLDKFKHDDKITKWIRKTIKKIPDNMFEIMEKYFNTDISFAVTMIYYIRLFDIQSVEEFLDKLRKTDFIDVLKDNLYTISKGYKVDPDITKERAKEILQNNASMMEFVKKLPINSKRKWDYLEICLNQDAAKNELIALFQWYCDEIYQKEIKKIEKICEKYEDELQEKLKKYGNEYLSLLTNIDYSKDNLNRDIVLVISYFSEIGYSAISIKKTNEDLFVLGYRHMEVFVERKHGVLANVHIFKALGDETRQNMIKLLAHKEWYGDELAQEMNLSNSTVSYHLNVLLLEGFVKVNRVDNRSYYTLNKDNLKKIIEETVEKMLK